jgi:hypothetical protein
MAKNRTIDDILRELSKDYQSVLLKAVQRATDTAAEDIYKFSMSVLERYYENYEPTSYDRSDSLWRATIPISDVIKQGNKIVSTVGVKYDPSVLEGVYDGSQKYEHPDGSWVLENYLMGIHPATNGSRNPDTVVYTPWQDTISPDTYLKKYLALYQSKLDSNVNNYLISHIIK